MDPVRNFVLLSDANPAREGDTVTGFSGLAYSGGVVPNHGWRGDMAIDLASMTLPQSTDVPVLLNHDPNQVVGRARVQNSGTELRVERGTFSKVTQFGKDVAALMGEGHPWALSIGVNARFHDADRSKPTRLNGRDMALDAVLRDARLLELSFVPSGADPSAYAARLSARMGVQPPEPSTMPPETPDIAVQLATATNRVAELERQVATLTGERDEARNQLATVRLNARNAAIVDLFGEQHGLTEPQLGAYRAMTDDQFDAARSAILAAREAADPALFRQQAHRGRNPESAGQVDFMPASGYGVDAERAQLHAKALQFQRDHAGTDYFAAVVAVSR